MFHNMYDHGWGMGWFWIIGLVLLVLIIWVVVKYAGQARTPDQPVNKTPIDILKERYARGEMDREEFEQKKKDLK